MEDQKVKNLTIKVRNKEKVTDILVCQHKLNLFSTFLS